MDPVTAVRSQVPPQASTSPPATDRPISAAMAPSVAAVTPPLRQGAVVQPSGGAGTVSARLAERDDSGHPAARARAAADAAREAYIRASIAAGISPLPLP